MELEGIRISANFWIVDARVISNAMKMSWKILHMLDKPVENPIVEENSNEKLTESTYFFWDRIIADFDTEDD